MFATIVIGSNDPDQILHIAQIGEASAVYANSLIVIISNSEAYAGEEFKIPLSPLVILVTRSIGFN